MNSEETRVIVKHIDAGVVSVRRLMRVHTLLYIVTAAITVWLVFLSLRLSRQQERNFNLASVSYKTAVEATARQDAADDRVMAYIKSVVEAWDKLQRDNPRIRVPKAPVDRPPGAPLPTDKELTRPPFPTPTVSPTPKPKTVVKYRVRAPQKPKSLFDYIFPKPSPTPKR